jgi:CRP/FNR family transcriptional regulator, cyclic AMP receptor protein
VRKVLFMFGDLSDSDIEWLAVAGEAKRFQKGAVLIHQGKPMEEIYILLDGQLSVQVASSRDQRTINTLQKGEIVGELSFLDSRPPTATVLAATDAVALTISRQKLRAKLERDTAFAAKFYRGLGVFLADRLRRATRTLGYEDSQSPRADEATDEIDPELLDTVAIAAKRFELLVEHLKTAGSQVKS